MGGVNADWSPDGYRIVVTMRNQKLHSAYGLFFLEPTTGVLKELADSKDLSDPRWSADGRYIAARDSSKHRIVLYDVHQETWTVIASGGLLQSPYWSNDGAFVYFQDQLDDEESVFRANVRPGKWIVYQDLRPCYEAARRNVCSAALQQNGSLYVMVERGATEIYALDLDLP